MPEATQVVDGVSKRWILKLRLDARGEGDVWSAYDFSSYLQKAGLNPETIRVNPMTRQRFLNECDQIFKKPQYAVKFLNNPNPLSLQKFASEVNTLKNLNDPHIVRIYDVRTEMPEVESEDIEPMREEDKQPPCPPFYVMELIEGEALPILAEKKKVYEAQVHEALALMVEIASALSLAHRSGIVHRDLNPENIFVRKDGTPVIIDFGICNVINGTMYNLTGRSSSVMNFTSPELKAVRVRDEDVCGSNDIYSFGKLLYYLISGGVQLPYDYHKRSEYDLRLKYPSKQMDAIYKVFDRTITEDIAIRIKTIDNLLETIKDELVEGTTCIFCHDGVYQELSTEMMSLMWPASMLPEIRQFHPRLYVCERCGNIQYFCEGRILEKHKA